MAEVLWCPVSATGTTSQFTCRWYPSRKNWSGRRIGDWSCGRSFDFTLSINPKRRRLVNGSVKMESFTPSTTPRMCFSDVNIEQGSENLDSGLDFEGVFRNEEEEQEIGCHEQKPDSLSNFLVHQRLKVELECEDDLSKSSVMTLVPAGTETRIHFLEERNEEILSKRILRLSRVNKIRSATELFDSMRFLGLKPNTHACNSLLSCLLRNRNLGKAFSVFQFMWTKENITGHTYGLLLKAVSEIKGCDFALDMFKQLEGDPKHKVYFDVILYNTMISICGRMNNANEAERIWTIMKEDGHKGTEITYSLLVSVFARCGRNNLALDAYDELIENNITPRADTMHAMISVCAREEKRDLALNIFQSMLENGLKPNLVACNTLINSLGKAGKVKLVFKVYGIAKSLGHIPDEYTWNALLTALYRANRYVDVIQLFNAVRSENLCQPNEHLYNTVLMACQKLGSWENAIKLLYEMEGSGLKSVSTSSYNLVIGACENARLPKVALQVYEHMVHRKCDPDTFTHLSLIRSCIWGSHWDDVKEILKRVEPDVSLYNAAIHGMCLRGEVKLAKKLYLRMREIGLKPDGKTRAMMLQNLKKD
ncbi:PREDICTED: pentatricopeptide repeat-containing protein At3g29290 [Tarenaya hassleriana]|uniref:pentatricopeptide repeat-containing protein At3g29290 n=1 Tax=Tarenaya hassleriana TaxID=28532 RepID=UPI00053C697F|nr:PREDICTED: pentatricopeptide repeat-containing protein At3g29290 [Tarenaya hassleriana]XP_010528391.1 PREDICTED: pentatricopeptide repeat-containing protein At3g29290 [Tarenaya hassleriana]